MVKIDKNRVFMNCFDNSKCKGCGKKFANREFLTVERNKDTSGLLCMDCSGLGHLVFLPAGDVAITTRAKKYSSVYAIVFRFSKARKRNERQGLLVEPEALERAVKESEDDYEIRMKRREKRLHKAGEVRKEIPINSRFKVKKPIFLPFGEQGKRDNETYLRKQQ